MAMRKRELTVMHPNAAGIDIGSASHYVAVSPDQSDEPVKEFGCFTEDIEAMADWLIECGVDVVASAKPQRWVSAFSPSRLFDDSSIIVVHIVTC